MASIYFADLKGNIGTDLYRTIQHIATTNSWSYIEKATGNVQSYHHDYILSIGDIVADLQRRIFIIIAYVDVSMSQLTNYNWALYICNILSIYNIPIDDTINIHFTNMNNRLIDTQTYNSHASQIHNILGDIRPYTVQII
ncbi:hypothetical protein CcNV_082 [Crangon crangon nudivirus]|uniref:Uncharacterized protein n=1 Tax=Crangon crangon nudivirus TaxID=2880838 RepID=A0AAE9BZS7_9VIRU|nr:hypothetical protein QKT25_gp083 [Crangon crangon nudivirus]UBZ25567.1 hypothetical protein CcNV_082 [Crangon crangon nudivirus]